MSTKSTDTTIAIVLGILILVGMFVVAKIVFLGSVLFVGLWVILQRLPGFHWFATHVPILVDAAGTVGVFMLLLALGVSSTTTFLASAVAGIELSIWVALLRGKHLRDKQASLVPAGEGVG